jgi:cell division protein FtsB
VQSADNQYVQQEQTIAELRAKEQELEREAQQLSHSGNIMEALEKHRQLLKIRQEIDAMRHSMT